MSLADPAAALSPSGGEVVVVPHEAEEQHQSEP